MDQLDFFKKYGLASHSLLVYLLHGNSQEEIATKCGVTLYAVSQAFGFLQYEERIKRSFWGKWSLTEKGIKEIAYYD